MKLKIDPRVNSVWKNDPRLKRKNTKSIVQAVCSVLITHVDRSNIVKCSFSKIAKETRETIDVTENQVKYGLKVLIDDKVVKPLNSKERD